MGPSKEGKEGRYERAHLREAVERLPDHHRRLRGHHPAGRRAADAALFVPSGPVDERGGRPLHRHLRRVRHGPGGPGHGHLLVPLRPGGHSHADPDRWPGHRHRHRSHRHRLRAEDQPPTAEHAPGEHLGPSDGGDPEADPVHLQGGLGGGAFGRSLDAARLFVPLRPIRGMDGPVPFRLRLLQRGLRRDGRPYGALLLPDRLQRSGGRAR